MGIQITIGLDNNYKLGVKLEGDENLIFALIGGMDYARDALIDRIKQRNGTLAWGSPVPPARPQQAPPPASIPIEEVGMYSTEQKVPREKAIEATLYAIKSLEMRVEKMKSSPEDATFVIDPTLLAQL